MDSTSAELTVCVYIVLFDVEWNNANIGTIKLFLSILLYQGEQKL